MWTLGGDEPVIPEVAFVRCAMALPLGATGSLSPTFVPARGVPLAVHRPCAFALLRMVSDHPEGSCGRLRYSFGGGRPSQTAPLARSGGPEGPAVQGLGAAGVVSQGWLGPGRGPGVLASHLSCARRVQAQRQSAVKLYGVFPSCRGSPASSRALQFHRTRGRDSAQIVTPFVRVRTCLTRNFATLGPL